MTETTAAAPKSARAKGTRMWGVVTPRGKVLEASAAIELLKARWHFALARKEAEVVRVRVVAEVADAR